MKYYVVFILMYILSLYHTARSDANFNPYQVLDVHKAANSGEIRKAYKKLVKEWHPDKNDSPNAQDKFIQIQQAYEILSNDEKRKQYDTQGFMSDNRQQWSHQPQNFKFSDFFGRDFGFDGFDDVSSSRSISKFKFFRQVLPDSYHTPQVLYVYSTFCAPCIAILKSSWERTAKELERLGVGVGTVDTTFSSQIAIHLRVMQLPTTVVIFQEQYSYYHGVISYENIKNFIVSQLPGYLVDIVTSSNIQRFLNGASYDDKPRALLFSKQKLPTLLYTLMAIKHQKYIKFGFASFSNEDTNTIGRQYGVHGSGPTLLIFKEDFSSPVVTLQSSDMPRGAVNEILVLHRYMTIPRILSQEVFDDLCPPQKDKTYNIHLCAIFASSTKRPGHADSLRNLRRAVTAALDSDHKISDWLRFVVVEDSKQPAFVQSLSDSETLPSDPAIYLTWRQTEHHGFTSTFPGQFLESDKTAEYEFQKFLGIAMQTAQQQRFERAATFATINDELAPFIVTRIVKLIWQGATKLLSLFYYLNEQEAMLILLTGGLILLSMMSSYTSRRKKKKASASSHPAEEDDVEVQVSYTDEEEEFTIENAPSSLKELETSTYEDLILRQERGFLTVVALLDKNDEVLDDFIDVIKSRSRDRKLCFAYLKMSSYLSWYVELRKASSAQPPDSPQINNHSGLSSLHSNCNKFQATELEVTSQNSHGTVLAINGHKHWYCIFVPRVGRTRPTTVQCSLSANNSVSAYGDGNSVETISASPSETNLNHSNSSDSQKMSPSDGASEYHSSLTRWLDRVCEGQMPRLYVRQWPGLYVRTPSGSDDEDD